MHHSFRKSVQLSVVLANSLSLCINDKPRSFSPRVPWASWGVATAVDAQIWKWIKHSALLFSYLLRKGRLGYCQPLYFCPNALWEGFLHAKNLHSKMQISVFLPRLSLEGTVHQYLWPHPNHLGLRHRTTQKGVGKKGKLMPLLFGWKWEI